MEYFGSNSLWPVALGTSLLGTIYQSFGQSNCGLHTAKKKNPFVRSAQDHPVVPATIHANRV